MDPPRANFSKKTKLLSCSLRPLRCLQCVPNQIRDAVTGKPASNPLNSPFPASTCCLWSVVVCQNDANVRRIDMGPRAADQIEKLPLAAKHTTRDA